MSMLIFAAGCAGGHHGRVRQLQSDVPSGCRYIGVAESSERSGWDMSDDQTGPVREIRKKVSAMGGNAFVLTHGAKLGSAATTRADVYRCP